MTITMPLEDRVKAMGKMHKKCGEDQTCSFEDMIAGRRTHRHAHHNTTLHYRGEVIRLHCL